MERQVYIYKKMSILSIILPVYNSAEYLPRCLDALRNQTMADLEFLCVDDGSTDESGKILDEYAALDNRFRVFHQKNSGPSASRNLALQNVTGKYLMFCDSDDWYEPDMCMRMYQTIEAENVDFVMCNTDVIVNTVRSHYMPPGSSLFPYAAGKHKPTEKFYVECNVYLWNKIFKKELIDRYQLDFPAVKRADDEAFSKCYFFITKSFYCLDEKLYHYFIRSHSIMDNFARNTVYEYNLDYLAIVDFGSRFLKKNNLYNEFYKTIICILHINLYLIWSNIPKEKRRNFFESVRTVLKSCGYRCESGKRHRLLNLIYRGKDETVCRKLEGIDTPWKLGPRIIRYQILAYLTWGKCRKYYQLKKKIMLYKLELYRKWKSEKQL